MHSAQSHLSDRLGIGYFIAPIPLAAVAILILNDHSLKRACPSFLTGKLSDLAGIFFFPIFLCAVWNLSRNVLELVRGKNRFHWITMKQGFGAILLTDLIFAAIKVLPAATEIYTLTLTRIGFPSVVTRDPTDLAALAMNLFTYWYIAYQDYSSSR